jgi:glycopeptide antibiotics resistance protein
MNALPQLLRPVSAAVLALGALPEIGFVLQIASVGTLVGALVAMRAKRRFAHADTWAITTAWTGLALLVGLVIALAAAIA